ncbi:hypothetical protein ACFB49_05310 [Sphingomonas sp. DBB INV C78]|uniref:hypothetical protein n=1 Tax=Sphingomonas sp. DBB INV C78 TaxID=3349434 RepID=UPI0036D3848D
MFLDLNADRFEGEPQHQYCHSCKGVIRQGEPTEMVRFDPDPNHDVESLNGLYHAACAKPFLRMHRAMQAMNRFLRF